MKVKWCKLGSCCPTGHTKTALNIAVRRTRPAAAGGLRLCANIQVKQWQTLLTVVSPWLRGGTEGGGGHGEGGRESENSLSAKMEEREGELGILSWHMS